MHLFIKKIDCINFYDKITLLITATLYSYNISVLLYLFSNATWVGGVIASLLKKSRAMKIKPCQTKRQIEVWFIWGS